MTLDRNALLQAYTTMRRIREFEERVNSEFVAGHVPGFVHLYSGEEAIAVGICMHLDAGDYIGSTHRGHGHSLAKGCDSKRMMLEIFGKAEGLCAGKGGSMHIADLERGMLGANAIVGGSPPLVIGAALTAKTLKSDRVAVAFTGDGGSNQGTIFEAMNMAVVLQLPALFVIENNGYGEGTAVEYAVGAKDLARRAAGFGMPAVKVDGRDFFAVYDAAASAVTRARAGGGPSSKGLLIQAIRDEDPVIFLEHTKFYDLEGEVPAESYTVPFGEATVLREGGDATIVALARMTHVALEAAAALAEKGVEVTVIDPRTTSPLDEETILESVGTTGRLLVVDESNPRCSVASEIAAVVAERGFRDLKAPIRRVTAPHTPVPFSPILENAYIPSAKAVEAAVMELMRTS